MHRSLAMHRQPVTGLEAALSTSERWLQVLAEATESARSISVQLLDLHFAPDINK